MKRSRASRGKCRPHVWDIFFTPTGAEMRRCIECRRMQAVKVRRR